MGLISPDKLTQTEQKSMPPIQGRVRQMLSQGLKFIEIFSGCGSRVCNICALSAKMGGDPMPFNVIEDILDIKSEASNGSRQINPYWACDPFAYEYERYSFADVAFAAFARQVPLAISTHGILPSDSIACGAADRIIKDWNTLLGLGFTLRYSIDPFGFVGMDTDTYWDIVKFNLDLFTQCEGVSVTIHYDPNAEDGPNSHDEMLYEVKSLIPQTQATAMYNKRRLVTEPIIPIGRASSIIANAHMRDIRMYDGRWHGYLIRQTGDILVKPYPTSILKPEPAGNIYESIPSELPKTRSFWV